MKAEIIAKLQELIEAPDPFKVQKEFKQLSSQYNSFSALEAAEVLELDDDDQDSEGDESSTEEATASAEVVREPKRKAESNTEVAAPITNMEVEPVSATVTETIHSDPKPESSITPVEETLSETESEVDISGAKPESSITPVEETPSETESEVDDSGAKPESSIAPVEDTPSETESEVDDSDAKPESSIAPLEDTPSETESELIVGDVGKESTNEPASDNSNEEIPTLDEQFKSILAAWKTKIEKAKVDKQRIETETLATAKDLIEELTSLITTEENIGKAFLGFNAIRDKWKALPKVSNDHYRDLNAEYNKQVELFFYNINIYKELKELDLKHNFEEKTTVLNDQKKLLEENDVRLLEVEVRLNQDRWNDIGPTHQDQWDALKEEFWSLTREIYKKIQNFYNQRKEEQGKHVEAREALLEKARQLAALELRNPKKWQEKTTEILEIQKEWNMVGFISKDVAAPMWKEFRKVCDNFFDNKRKFFDEIKKVQDVNKLAKQELVDKAETLKGDENWKDTAHAFTELQKSWKEIGPAHQRDENKLWTKFREACDHFFQARKTNQSSANAEQKENLDKKLALIAQVNAVDNSDRKAMMDTLKEISEQWRAIGHVPFRDKDKVNDGYKAAVDAKFDGINIDKKVKEKMRFEQRVGDLKDRDHGDRYLRKEQDILLSKISKIQSEVTLLENNMGFFAASKGADKFKVEIQRKIDKGREDIADLQDKMKMLTSA